MCAHGGTSDPVSRCKIRSKCTGKDVIGHRKSRDVLISQSNVCLSLVGPIKGHVWGNKARGSRNDNTSATSSLGERNMGLGTIQRAY